MVTIRSGGIEASVATKGAELQSLVAGGLEYLWQGDPAFWPRRSPLLFPVIGGLPGGRFSFEGRTYKMGNHGFARDLEFRLASSSADSLRLELKSDEASLELYPFRFVLAVGYKAVGDRLEVGYELRNAGTKRMPFSIGAHPAFRAPLVGGETREDFDLEFEKSETVDRHFLNAENLLSGESEPFLRESDRVSLSPDLFERGAIVLKDHLSRRVTLRSRVSGRFVELSFPDFPQLGIWSPRGQVPFVCVEPWIGVMPLAHSTQDLEAKEGMLFLGPGAVFRAAFSVRLG